MTKQSNCFCLKLPPLSSLSLQLRSIYPQMTRLIVDPKFLHLSRASLPFMGNFSFISRLITCSPHTCQLVHFAANVEHQMKGERVNGTSESNYLWNYPPRNGNFACSLDSIATCWNYWWVFEFFMNFFSSQRFTETQLIDQSVYILIAIGGLMFVLGFLGYCGAIRESQCLLSLVSWITMKSFFVVDHRPWHSTTNSNIRGNSFWPNWRKIKWWRRNLWISSSIS